jgi:hypothetical protein
VGKSIEKSNNKLTDNVIDFPEYVRNRAMFDDEKNKEDDDHQESLDFAYSVIEYAHDELHEETGDCIFTDEIYKGLVILIAESLTALHLLQRGEYHPMQEIAEDFADGLDIDDVIGYGVEEQPPKDNDER